MDRETTAAIPGEGRFTDAHLVRALEEAGSRAVVVYGWSPHMPLSGEGWAEIEDAARRLDVHVEPVLIMPSDTASPEKRRAASACRRGP